jgi:hypothetical protein
MRPFAELQASKLQLFDPRGLLDHLLDAQQIDGRLGSARCRGIFVCAKHALYGFTPKNEANDALDLLEPLRIEREGYFNPEIRRPIDVEHEPRRSKLDQAELEVPSIPVGVMRLDVANAAIIVLELALNEEVGLHWR